MDGSTTSNYLEIAMMRMMMMMIMMLVMLILRKKMTKDFVLVCVGGSNQGFCGDWTVLKKKNM